MKKKSLYKLIISSSFVGALFPLLISQATSKNSNHNNENIVLNLQKNNLDNARNAEAITISDQNILKSSNFAQVRTLLETPLMTQEVLNKLSISLPTNLEANLVSFTNINNGLFKITFTINYNGVAKPTNDFLNITPTNQEVANSIFIENNNILSSQNGNHIKSLLETASMTQEILNQLSVTIPTGADPTKVSFTEISTTNPLRVTFKIKYGDATKNIADYLTSTTTNEEIVKQIVVDNNDAVVSNTVIQIRKLLETNPMTQEILTKLSIRVPEGIDVTKVSFKKINVSNLFKVTFEIYYNNVPKGTTDFLNATLTDQQTVERTTVQDNNALSQMNINNIKGLLEVKPMTSDILSQLSIQIPERAVPANFSFKNIDISNPFRITFTISYNNVDKKTPDFLNATPIDKEVAEASTVSNSDILLGHNVEYIKNILETKTMTKEILDSLSIKIPEGAIPANFSFTNIDISNLFKVTFKIAYNKVSKDVADTLNATPTDLEVVTATTLKDPDILSKRTVTYIKSLLETSIMTNIILEELGVQIPTDSTPSKFSFSNINIENPFKVTFTINYNNTPKLTNDTLNATPTDQEIVNTIVVQNVNILSTKKVIEIRNILETKPLTTEILDQLSIKLFGEIVINRITFTSINIDNPLRITFTINYNGVPKETLDYFNASATDEEIVNAINVGDVNAVKSMSVMQIRDLLETEPMTIETLEKLSIKLHVGMDITKLAFTEIDIDNLFKVTFRISYNNVYKTNLDFLNATATNQDVVNRISIGNQDILKEKDNDYVQLLLQTTPMTANILKQLSVIIFEGVDPTKISFSDINITNPIRVTFVITYDGVRKTATDFLNTTQSDQEIANAILVKDADILKGSSVFEIRDLLETKPLTSAILNKLSISLPEGAQLFRLTFTNINIVSLFQISFQINYNNVAKSEVSSLNATPSNQDVLNWINIVNPNILVNQPRESIKALLATNPMTTEILKQMSITIPTGVDVANITFTNVSIENPFRVTFTINYNGVPKKAETWLNTTATDEEAVAAISVIEPSALQIESAEFIKNLLEQKQTVETLEKLSIKFPIGADVSKITFSNINISDPLKVVFTINYNGTAKSTTSSLNTTPADKIANAVIVENPDILKTQNVSYIETLLKTSPMTKAILDELGIKLPVGIPAERISFTNIDVSNLFAITFTINYNGIPKSTSDSLTATPTDQDIANAIFITNFDVLNKMSISEVKALLETNPITQEILDQLSINVPKNIDISKITFTNINTDNVAKITFTINYNGFASNKEAYFNVFVPVATSNTILIVSIVVPVGVILIAALVGFYFWNKEKSENVKKDKMKNQEINKKNAKWYDEQGADPAADPAIEDDKIAKAILQPASKPIENKQASPKIEPKVPDNKEASAKPANQQPANNQTPKPVVPMQAAQPKPSPQVNKVTNVKPVAPQQPNKQVAPQQATKPQNQQQPNKQKVQTVQDNGPWYDNQGNGPYYYNEQGNEQWYYNEQLPGDQQWYYSDYYDEQGNLKNSNDQYPVDRMNQQANGENLNWDDDKTWIDNKWYSNQAETGEWRNGDWHENEEYKKNKDTRTQEDDWGDIFKIIEK